jgi:hypothetical protein
MLTPNVLLLQALRLPFWFACFWAVIGVAWRPPMASVGLITIFLGLLVSIEWASRRLSANKLPKIDTTEPMEDTIKQQTIRTQTAEGVDRFEGTFWAEFPTNAMSTTVHVPFCPAFERVPKVQVFSVDETGLHLRITSPKTFGVRIDIKRNNLETARHRFAMIAEG